MKRILAAAVCFLCSLLIAAAQEGGLNSAATDITGTYLVAHEGENSRVKVFQDTDGTFSARIIWVENRLDRNGNIRLDEKNPDKSLRNVPCDQIVIMERLKYNPDRKRWDNGKIYDPTRGIRANVTCSFDSPTILRVRGSLMGIGETVFWQKIDE